jgi:hypothetical protein
MKKSVPQSETTVSAAKKTNGLYVASVNRRLIIEDMGEQYACRNVDTPDYSQLEESFDENWMPAVLTGEETLYDKYY